MKALTIRQPYAELIVLGVKTIETRSRPWWAGVGMRIAIHAGKARESGLVRSVLGQVLDRLDEQAPFRQRLWRLYVDPEALDFGAVIGTAELACCHPAESATNRSEIESIVGDFGPGRWAWDLAEPRRTGRPIEITGHQGIWSFDPRPFCPDLAFDGVSVEQ